MENVSDIMEKNELKRLCNLVLKENYVSFNGNLCIQQKGILQDAVASNCLASLYLHVYEKERSDHDNIIMFK